MEKYSSASSQELQLTTHHDLLPFKLPLPAYLNKNYYFFNCIMCFHIYTVLLKINCFHSSMVERPPGMRMVGRSILVVPYQRRKKGTRTKRQNQRGLLDEALN